MFNAYNIHFCWHCWCSTLIRIEHQWNSFENMLLMNCIKWLSSRNSSFTFPQVQLINYKTFVFMYTHTRSFVCKPPSFPMLFAIKLRLCLIFSLYTCFHKKKILLLFTTHYIQQYLLNICAFYFAMQTHFICNFACI